MNNAEIKLYTTLKCIGAVVAEHAHSIAPDLASWFAHYAASTSEFADTGVDALDVFFRGVTKVIELVGSQCTQDAITLIGQVFESLTVEDAMPFAMMISKPVESPVMLSLAPHIVMTDSARYGFAAMLLGMASGTKMPLLQAQHVAKMSSISVDEVLRQEERQYQEITRQLNELLGAAGFPELDISAHENSLHYPVAKSLFGAAWAALYGAEPLTITNLFKYVCMQRPPFITDAIEPGAVPDAYSY